MIPIFFVNKLCLIVQTCNGVLSFKVRIKLNHIICSFVIGKKAQMEREKALQANKESIDKIYSSIQAKKHKGKTEFQKIEEEFMKRKRTESKDGAIANGLL